MNGFFPKYRKRRETRLKTRYNAENHDIKFRTSYPKKDKIPNFAKRGDLRFLSERRILLGQILYYPVEGDRIFQK